MTVRDLIRALLEKPMDSQVYIGKGMGPLASIKSETTDRIYVVLSPFTKFSAREEDSHER